MTIIPIFQDNTSRVSALHDRVMDAIEECPQDMNLAEVVGVLQTVISQLQIAAYLRVYDNE